MTKEPLSLFVEDITPFTRNLAKQLGPDSPKHLALMNMLARSAGFQNLQHMRANQAAEKRLAKVTPRVPSNQRAVERALNQFDDQARLVRWPSKRLIQDLALWALWARFPTKVTLAERQVNEALNKLHSFGDPATLRRIMVTNNLLTRNQDGSDYRRVEREPTVEAKALISALGIGSNKS